MNIRKHLYFFLSKIRKTPVIDFLKEYKLDEADKKDLRNSRLNHLLQHAKENTMIYSDYNSFEEFPLINKDFLRENYDKFLSKKLDPEKAIKTRSSGSSGQPMVYYLTKEKKYRHNADAIFYNSWANYEIGDKFGYSRIIEKSKLTTFIRNETVLNPTNFTDEWLRDKVNLLKKKKIVALIGFPTSIVAIAKKAKKENLNASDFAIKSIIITGEATSLEDKELLTEVFGVIPIDRYSTEEFGVIAASCKVCGKFHMNDVGLIVEVLDLETNMPVKKGEIGKIVITDLFSHHMPLIRFETGDLATYGGTSTCDVYPTGEVLESINGREIEILYDTHGNKISPWAISEHMKFFTSINQFQFVQKDIDDNELNLVINENYNKTIEQEIKKAIESLLGTPPKINIVDEIPAQKTGKRPYIVSLYNLNK